MKKAGQAKEAQKREAQIKGRRMCCIHTQCIKIRGKRSLTRCIASASARAMLRWYQPAVINRSFVASFYFCRRNKAGGGGAAAAASFESQLSVTAARLVNQRTCIRSMPSHKAVSGKMLCAAAAVASSSGPNAAAETCQVSRTRLPPSLAYSPSSLARCHLSWC